ncbi:unnamed protein product [Xylocopa violacea]|uniref:MOSC domain-containing protein n=1 Tax=Xylocopa violacea TaxID=135666 RepID=A0ABP1N7E0_XYLVO
MILDRPRLPYVSTAAVSVGTVVVFVWWWWTKRQKEQPPSKWRKVGELSDLVVYPVKSLGPIRINKLECTILGSKSGWLRDRALMVTDQSGHFVTARQWPQMVLVSPSISGSILTLSAPGMPSESIDLSQLQGKGKRVTLWGSPVDIYDCGDAPARWLSQFLLQKDTGLRLVYHPWDFSTRGLPDKRRRFSITTKDTGVYQDETSYCLINESSVTELNTRLDEPVTPQHFRPNFVIKGATAFEEDSWGWVKIGDVIFKCVRPCTRCLMITINPETGMKSPIVEPMKTLKSYRQVMDPVIRPVVGESPVMGVHLGLRGPSGTIQLGDPVYVGVPEVQPILISSP